MTLFNIAAQRSSMIRVKKMLAVVLALSTLAVLAAAQQPSKSTGEPDAIEQHFQAAQTFQLAGDFPHAEEEYHKTISVGLERLGNIRASGQKYAEAIPLLNKSLQLDPTNTEASISLAVVYFYTGELEKAKSLVAQVLEHEPSNFRALNLMGKIAFVQGQYEAAVEKLQAALAIQADFDVAYSLALANLQLKKLPQATVLFDEMKTSMKSSPELHMLIGRAYREAGFAEQAAGEFEKVISFDPKASHAHSLLGQTYLMEPLKKYGEAKKQFEAELDLNPMDLLSRYYLGVVDFQLREFPAAESTLQRVTRERPESSDAFLYLGRVYLAESRLEEAAQALRKAIALAERAHAPGENRAQAHSSLAEVLNRQGKKDEGAAEMAIVEKLKVQSPETQPAQFRDVLDPSKSAEGQARDAMIINTRGSSPPKSPDAQYVESVSQMIGEAYHNLGVIDARNGQYHNASSDFAESAQWNPKIATLDRNWGLAAFRAEQFEQAIPPLSRQLSRTSGDAAVRQMLGVSYFMTDDFLKSAETFRPIIRELPDNPGLLYAAGMSLVRSGDSATAEKLFARMLDCGAGVPEIHLVLGEAYSQQSQYAEALNEFQTASRLKPHLQDVHYYTGMVLFKQGKLDEATREFNAELSVNPKSIAAKYQLAYIDLQQHQSDDAIRLLREVLEEKPSYADAHYQLGKALLEKNDLTAAIQHLETATKLQPGESYGFYQLSMAYRRAGRIADAERALRTYQALKDKAPRTSPM